MKFDHSDYQFRFDCKPDFGFLTVALPAERSIKVEASAMAAMDSTLEMKTTMKGGFGRFLTGESLFVNEFTARKSAGEISIAPAAPGDIGHVYLENENIFLQNSAFVASSPEVKLESKWQGFTKGFFSGESLFLVRCSGTGDLWFNTYGAMICVDVDGEYVVDTGHIVAFTEGLNYRIGSIGGLKSFFLSGEGLVCRFSGKGKIWIQTRQVPAFTGWVWPFRPAKKNG